MSALLAEPRPLRSSAAADSIAAAAHALDQAVRLFQTDGSRVARWRIVSQLIEARRQLAVHASPCAAGDGPLVHVTSLRPRLEPVVRKTVAEHERMLEQLDGLITSITASSPDTATSAAHLSCVLKISAAVIGHQRRATEIVYEWANRDIGGES